MPPWGMADPFLPGINQAVEVLLALLYKELAVTIAATNEPKPERNRQIQSLYAEGLSIPTIARRFGLSNARVHQVLHGRRN